MQNINHDQKKQFRESPKMEGYCYSDRKARQARDNNQLLSLRIETSLACNLKCKYCCEGSGQPLSSEISYEKIIDIINEAKELGTKSIVIIGGGEPTIYPHFKDLVRYIHSHKMIPVIFTNTQIMTKELAQFLYDNNVSVITKLDSLDEKIQDDMVGIQGAYKNIRRGLENLIDAGYTNCKDEQKLKLGASFVVNQRNAFGVANIWRFCREKKIFPNLEMMTPTKRAKDNKQLLLNKEQWKRLKLKLLEIDENEFGYTWLPYTPILAAGCLQVLYSLYINVQGFVRPCAGIHTKIANIKNYSLKEIIQLPFFQVARKVDKNLQGKCKDCEYISQCIGCRGLAYSYENNIKHKNPSEALCAEDPSCFKQEI